MDSGTSLGSPCVSLKLTSTPEKSIQHLPPAKALEPRTGEANWGTRQLASSERMCGIASKGSPSARNSGNICVHTVHTVHTCRWKRVRNENQSLLVVTH